MSEHFCDVRRNVIGAKFFSSTAADEFALSRAFTPADRVDTGAKTARAGAAVHVRRFGLYRCAWFAQNPQALASRCGPPRKTNLSEPRRNFSDGAYWELEGAPYLAFRAHVLGQEIAKLGKNWKDGASLVQLR